MFSRFVLIMFLCVSIQTFAHDESSRAQYLGNEGVLVQHGKSSILFDAFYSESYGQYLLVDESTQNALLAGKPPYENVQAVFVSHVHGDHFSPGPAQEYLRAHKEVKLFGSGQVIDKLTAGTDEFTDQVVRYDLKPGDDAMETRLGGLVIGVVAVPHAGGERMAHIDNLAFRVRVDDGATVVHLGDAGPDLGIFQPLADFFQSDPIEAAFPPYWFLGDAVGRQILDTIIRAEMTVGIHVPAQAQGDGDKWRQEANGDLFTDPGEDRSIPGGD